MALKIIYTKITGSLTANISAAATALPIDSDTLALLQANVNFAGGDWTYLSLDNGIYSEEVKVTNIYANFLTVVRAASGSVAQAFAASNTVVSDKVGADAIKDIIAANPAPSALTVVGGGLASATTIGNNVQVSVPPPQFQGSGGISVLGIWPDIEFALESASEGCGCGGSGGSGGVNQVTVNSSILQAAIADAILTLTLSSPSFTGAGGVAVSGSWADGYTITGTGGGGTGTVTSVSAGTGLTLTGSATTNPTLSLTATGVAAGTYGGFTFNAQGQLTGVAAGYAPVGSLAFVNGADVALTGTSYTITLHPADVGVPGIVALADSSAPLSSTDDSTAVTPKLLSLALTGVGGIIAGAGSSNGESDASYSNVVSTTAINITLSASQKAIIYGEVQLNDGTNAALAFGVAVFNASNVKQYGSKITTQSKQTILFMLSGPVNTALSIATTALPTGASVSSAFLAAVIR